MEHNLRVSTLVVVNGGNMRKRNLIEITVDMTNKHDEMIQIINLYLSQIDAKDSKAEFLAFLSKKIDMALDQMKEE